MLLHGQIHPELKEKVDRELQPGERILWMDMPIPKFFNRESTTIFLFGIVWTLFAIFWTVGAAGFTIPNLEEVSNPFKLVNMLFPHLGTPFIIIGFFLLANPIFAYRKAFKTVYVITDRRAITFELGWLKIIRSYPPAQLLNVYRKERRDGTGDVIISSDKGIDSNNARRIKDPGFLQVREPKTVEMMLRDLAKQSGIDVSIKPPLDSMARDTERYYASLEATEHGRDLTQSKASTRIGKLIVVIIFTCLIGYGFNSMSLKDYEKGQRLTLNEYVEGYEDYKADLLDYDPLWVDILVGFIIVGIFFCSYELLGKGVGWILWKTILARRGRTGPWRGA